MMKLRNSSRKSTVCLYKRKRPSRRKQHAHFLLNLIALLVLVGGFLAGGYWGGTKLYRRISQARLADWHVKSVAVEGVDGNVSHALFDLAATYQNKSFTLKNVEQLQQLIRQKYPVLTEVSVKRGVFNGQLTIRAKRRIALAKFTQPDGSVLFIDTQGGVYPDVTAGKDAQVPSVELEGRVPSTLSKEFVDLVESTYLLNKELPLTLLQMNLDDNTVRMLLPDGNEIDFGPAVQLKEKAARAAQIIALAREKYKSPFLLRFTYFENGKVFLTQKSS